MGGRERGLHPHKENRHIVPRNEKISGIKICREHRALRERGGSFSGGGEGGEKNPIPCQCKRIAEKKKGDQLH